MDELLKQYIEQNIPLTIDIATVIKVKGDLCHVESNTTEKDFFNCRINAIEVNEGDRMKVTPSEGSTVVIGIFKNTEKAIVLSVSEAETINFKKGDTDFTINALGYNINRGSKNLKTIFNDLINKQNEQNDSIKAIANELKKVIVSIGTSPNVPALNGITETLDQIVNDNENIRTDLNTILI